MVLRFVFLLAVQGIYSKEFYQSSKSDSYEENTFYSPDQECVAIEKDEFSDARGENVTRLYIKPVNLDKNELLVTSELGMFKWLNNEYIIYSNSHKYRTQDNPLLYFYDINNNKSTPIEIKISGI